MAEANPDTPPTGDMLAHYSAALDEIYQRRQHAAYEAHIISGVLAFQSLPKGARRQLEMLRERMLLAARGEDVMARVDSSVRQTVMAIARMRPTLTRQQWEAERRG